MERKKSCAVVVRPGGKRSEACASLSTKRPLHHMDFEWIGEAEEDGILSSGKLYGREFRKPFSL